MNILPLQLKKLQKCSKKKNVFKTINKYIVMENRVVKDEMEKGLEIPRYVQS